MKTPQKRKKQQLTETHKNTKYQNVSLRGSIFSFSLPGGRLAPLPPLVTPLPTMLFSEILFYSRGGEPIYYHGPNEMCIVAGGLQNQWDLS